MKEKLVISGCLLGLNCKYNGKNNYNPMAEELGEKYDLIIICPEQMGGLPTPRVPSERFDDKVINKEGEDVTSEFKRGAEMALEKAGNIRLALLKDGSPSCGSSYIYDGTFTGKKIEGLGVTAELFLKNGFEIYSENTIEKLKER